MVPSSDPACQHTSRQVDAGLSKKNRNVKYRLSSLAYKIYLHAYIYTERLSARISSGMVDKERTKDQPLLQIPGSRVNTFPRRTNSPMRFTLITERRLIRANGPPLCGGGGYIARYSLGGSCLEFSERALVRYYFLTSHIFFICFLLFFSTSGFVLLLKFFYRCCCCLNSSRVIDLFRHIVLNYEQEFSFFSFRWIKAFVRGWVS